MVGYDLLECANLDEAIEVASKHPLARHGAMAPGPSAPPARRLARPAVTFHLFRTLIPGHNGHNSGHLRWKDGVKWSFEMES